jgi:hypothetical protein
VLDKFRKNPEKGIIIFPYGSEVAGQCAASDIIAAEKEIDAVIINSFIPLFFNVDKWLLLHSQQVVALIEFRDDRRRDIIIIMIDLDASGCAVEGAETDDPEI